MRVQCSTCLELLTPGDDLTCTPCGHIFHMACVVQWFETKKNCPQCRHSANERTLRKIYLAETDGDQEQDADSLQNHLDSAQYQLRCKETERSKFAEKNKELQVVLKKQKEEIKTLETSRLKAKGQADAFKSQNRILQEERFSYEEAKREAEELKHKLENHKSVELAIKGQEGELNKFLHERGAFDSKTRDLATLVVMLKQKMADVKKERSAAENRLKEASREQGLDKKKVKELEGQVIEMQSINRSLEGEVWKHKEDMKAMRDNLECLEQDEDTINPIQNSTLKDLPTSPSPPPPSQSKKLPNFKLACSVKRSLSPDDRSPFLPMMNHSSKRLTGGLKPASMQPTNSLTKHYDGLGGRSRLDMFPKPRSNLNNFTASQQTSRVKQNKVGVVGKQAKTIDKFFGSFDTP